MEPLHEPDGITPLIDRILDVVVDGFARRNPHVRDRWVRWFTAPRPLELDSMERAAISHVWPILCPFRWVLACRFCKLGLPRAAFTQGSFDPIYLWVRNHLRSHPHCTLALTECAYVTAGWAVTGYVNQVQVALAACGRLAAPAGQTASQVIRKNPDSFGEWVHDWMRRDLAAWAAAKPYARKLSERVCVRKDVWDELQPSRAMRRSAEASITRARGILAYASRVGAAAPILAKVVQDEHDF